MEQVDIAKKLREIVNSDSSTSPPVCLDPRRITVPFERRLVPSHYPDKAPGRARNHFVVYLGLGSIVPTTRLLILFLILFVTMTATCRHRRCARSKSGPQCPPRDDGNNYSETKLYLRDGVKGDLCQCVPAAPANSV